MIMREILFRAKRTDNGEWVEGFYSQLPKPSLGATIITNGDLCAEDVSDYIIVNECKQHSNFSNSNPLEVVECEYYEIDPETICQYIGETDKEGKKIFEGDIIGFITLGSTESGYSKSSCLGEVVWSKEKCCFHVTNRLSAESWEVLAGCKVLGNVFDNKEMLDDFLDLYTGWPTI